MSEFFYGLRLKLKLSTFCETKTVVSSAERMKKKKARKHFLLQMSEEAQRCLFIPAHLKILVLIICCIIKPDAMTENRL